MADFKFACPGCGQHIECDPAYRGKQAHCPACKQLIIVPLTSLSPAPAPAPVVPETKLPLPPRPPVPDRPVAAPAAEPKSVPPAQPSASTSSPTGRSKKILWIVAAVIVAVLLVVAIVWLLPKSTSKPAGAIAWWRGEGNAKDKTGFNDGTLKNVHFAKGLFGQAFVFKGGASIQFHASRSLNVGLDDGFTIEAWIKPGKNPAQTLFEWNQNNGANDITPIGAHLEIAGTQLHANIRDVDGASHHVQSRPKAITPDAFQHVALTFDKSSGAARLYINGASVGTANLGHITPQTGFDLFIGTRPAGPLKGRNFSGLMDEPCIYKRALSPTEIKALYNAGK